LTNASSESPSFNLRGLFAIIAGIALVLAVGTQRGPLAGFLVGIVLYGVFLSITDRTVWPAVVAAIIALILTFALREVIHD
jgi:hypothetical protein